MITNCKYCGSDNLVLDTELKDKQEILKLDKVALKCADCGKWLKWCPKEERNYYLKNHWTDLGDGVFTTSANNNTYPAFTFRTNIFTRCPICEKEYAEKELIFAVEHGEIKGRHICTDCYKKLF